ncbi:MAG: ABC transporter permease [Chloroflexota bacterium]|nr:ABC transporter permease [Chloroflexota bacterium]
MGWGLTGLVLFLVTWQVVGMRTNPVFFSTPTGVAASAGPVFEKGHLLSLYLNTMKIYLVGLALATFLGVSLGILTGLNRRARYLLDPLAVAAYSTPSLVLIPVFILWFGTGDPAKIALMLFTGIFPNLVNTQLGVDQMGPQMSELGRSFGANRRELLTQIVLPAIVPYSMAGVRLAVPRAFVAILAAEMLITAGGVGGLIVQYGDQFQTSFYFVPVILIVLTSYVLTELVKLLERRLSPWAKDRRA